MSGTLTVAQGNFGKLNKSQESVVKNLVRATGYCLLHVWSCVSSIVYACSLCC